MTLTQIIILVGALIASVLIVWHDLPIQFPWIINVVMLFLKLSGVLAFTGFAYIIAGGEKKSSGRDKLQS